jgi:GDSL-like lipase/acylhydrolase family protein
MGARPPGPFAKLLTRAGGLPLGAWLLGSIALGEVGLRVAGFEHRSAPDPVWTWDVREDPMSLAGDGLHEWNQRLLWTPIPCARIRAGPGGAGEPINARGYRGPELHAWKPKGVLRVALLGDAVTFGSGVRWEETYARQLVRELAERGRPAEVIDAGVAGYTVEQGLGRYGELVAPLNPDVVVLAFCGDAESAPATPVGDRVKIAYSIERGRDWPWLAQLPQLDLRCLQLAQRLSEPFAGPALGPTVPGEQDQRRRQRLSASAEDSGKPDWPGQRRVPASRFEERVAALVDLVRRDGARPVLLSIPRAEATESAAPVLRIYSEALDALSVGGGVPLCDCRRAYLDSRTPGSRPGELFGAPPDLTPQGHAFVASRLAASIEALDDSGVR